MRAETIKLLKIIYSSPVFFISFGDCFEYFTGKLAGNHFTSFFPADELSTILPLIGPLQSLPLPQTRYVAKREVTTKLSAEC